MLYKFFPGTLIAGLILTGSPLLMAQPIAIDRVIAIVDEEVILQSELDARLMLERQALLERNMPLPPADELREGVLDLVISESLQLQLAERVGIRVDDNMLNAVLTSIAEQNGLTFNQFRQALESQNAYLSTRRRLRQELTLNQLQNGAVNQRIDISRQEIENYLRSEVGLSDIAPEYHVAHVLIPSTDTTASSRTQELTDFLYTQINQGADIVDIASSRSISGIELNGGDLGWHKVEGLPSLFADIIPSLESGEVAKPFTSASGFHIVKLLDIRGGVNLSIDQTHARHILIAPNEIRTEQQAEQLIHQLHERILNGEDFADIARQNTDDDNSMVAGGDLDWVSLLSQMPEDFMAVMNATEIGEMTEPFRVSSGWHILEVLERRVEDVTEENKRFLAEQTLRERKYEMERQNWLTEIRDTAYIDLKESVD